MQDRSVLRALLISHLSACGVTHGEVLRATQALGPTEACIGPAEWVKREPWRRRQHNGRFRSAPGCGILLFFHSALEIALFKTEASWLQCALDPFPRERLSPLLNLGSSSAARREIIQPWVDDQVFRPLRERGVEIIHVDMRDLLGVDIVADLTNAGDVCRLRSLKPNALLCCNLLEHVLDPGELARHCLDLLPPGGLVFVTVPFSYPYHRDPIDTMYRPGLAELAEQFAGARLVEGTILASGETYRDEVRERPWILLRHIFRFLVPFLSFERWKRSMARLYWLVAEYRITCAVFEKM